MSLVAYFFGTQCTAMYGRLCSRCTVFRSFVDYTEATSGVTYLLVHRARPRFFFFRTCLVVLPVVTALHKATILFRVEPSQY